MVVILFCTIFVIYFMVGYTRLLCSNYQKRRIFVKKYPDVHANHRKRENINQFLLHTNHNSSVINHLWNILLPNSNVYISPSFIILCGKGLVLLSAHQHKILIQVAPKNNFVEANFKGVSWKKGR